MAAIELANAYVTIVPSLKGAQKQITSQLAGIDTTKAGSKVGAELSSSIGRALNFQSVGAGLQDFGGRLSSVGARLTNGITKPAVAAGAAVSGLVGALGFKRLVGIDTARGQFKGLGYDADAVMEQVDRGVTNTALSMAQGASAAVSILATGAVPLEDLEAQIKRVANVSAAYGVEAEHANYLLNGVLTKQKVTWGDLSQMQQNQIPVVTALADTFGYTGEQIQQMASDGEISIDMLNEALDAKAGAAAEEYAKTWKGVTANILSNLGRLGAEMLDGSFVQLKEEAQGFLDVLKSDEAKAFAQDLGRVLDETFSRIISGIRAAVEWWGTLSDGQKKALGALAGSAIALGPLLKVTGALTSGFGSAMVAAGDFSLGLKGMRTSAHDATGVAALLGSGARRLGGAFSGLWNVVAMSPLGRIVTIASAAAGALGLFFTKTETGRGIWQSLVGVFDSASSVIGRVASVVGGALQSALAAVGPLVESLLEALGPLLGRVASGIGAAIEPIATTLGPMFAEMFATMSEAIQPLADQVVSELLPAIMDLGAAFGEIWAEIQPVIAEIAAVLGPVISEVVEVVTAALAELIPVIAEIAATVVPVVTEIARIVGEALGMMIPIISEIVAVVGPLIGEIVAAIGPLISALNSTLIPVIQSVLKIVTDVFSAIVPVIQGALEIVTGIIQTVTALIRGDWEGVWNGIKAIVEGVWNTIKAIVVGAVNIVASVITNTVERIMSVWSIVWGAVKDFFSSVWQSIVNAAGNFGKSVQDKFTAVTDFIGSIPAKIFEFFAGIGTWLLDSGKALIQGFLDGIMAGFNTAKQWVADGLGAIRDLFPFSPAKEGPFSGRGWVAYSGLSLGSTFTQSIADSLHDGRSDVSSELDGLEDEFQRVEDYANGHFRVSTASPDFATHSGGPAVVNNQTINAQPGMDAEDIGNAAMRRMQSALGGL